MEFEEDLVEDPLPDWCWIIEQPDFEVGGPCSFTCPETVQRIVKIYRRPYPTICHF